MKGLFEAGYLEEWTYHATLSGTPQGGLCAAAHNPPYVQCRIMRSADPSTLVRAGSGAEALRITRRRGASERGEPVEQSGILVPFGQVVGDDVDVGGFEGSTLGFGGGTCVDLGRG